MHRRFYSPAGLWRLFLICALPLHIWTILLAFRDFDWITARTNPWDAVGVASYGLVFTLLESLILFVAAALLGFLVSRRWGEDHRIALLGTLTVVASLWAMASQLYFLWAISPSPQVIGFFAGNKHPLRLLYAAALVVVTPTFLIPTFLLLASQKILRTTVNIMERLSLLMTVYLVVDGLALINILIRNL
jgi:hypothetical protein